MKPTTELFDLIHSLSRTEKGYFKKFASLHIKGGENNYIKLFDAVEAQKEYDESAIKKKFEGETFIKHLPSEKNYLQQLIMKSLRLYHAKDNVGKEIRELIDYIEIYMDKGLYKQCEKMINKAKKLAMKHERFLHLAEIAKWEKKLHSTRGNALDRTVTGLIHNTILKAIEDELTVQQFFKMQDEMVSVLESRGEARTEEDLQVANERIKNILAVDKSKMTSTVSSILYNNTLAAYYYFVGDYESSYKHSRAYIDAAKIDFKRTNDSTNYINGLHNHYTACYRTGRYEECFGLIDKIKAIPSKSHKGDDAIFSRVFSIEVGLGIVTGKFEETVKVVEANAERILQFRDRMPLTAYFNILYYVGYTYFGAGKYSEAIRWLNRIINDPDADEVQYIFCATKILLLVVHTDMGKSDSLEYIVKPTYRYLYKRKRLYKFESGLLHFIKNEIPKIHSRTELVEAYKKFLDQIRELKKDAFEIRVFDYFDFESWLESKIESKPFSELVYEKSLRLIKNSDKKKDREGVLEVAEA